MKEVNILGIYVAPFALYFLIALILFVIVRKFLDRWEVERWFWHRHLFDFAIFVILLSLVSLVL